eukprot:2268730-Heterocapsa_arctica.AAC.1
MGWVCTGEQTPEHTLFWPRGRSCNRRSAMECSTELVWSGFGTHRASPALARSHAPSRPWLGRGSREIGGPGPGPL